ncbi:UNVERIFIED_CONTAM: hypothetical protein Sradi_3253900 [Sesamum radiatum]|uniref:GAG-pre-integrase domain-containing protein n=1 Tax=Sesamum radiatum TaxID=300843 RepID=A0AAW2R047_SESRA
MLVVDVSMIPNSVSWVLDTDCGAHICSNFQVLERSRKLSKDEMVLRLGDGKVVVTKAVGSLSLVISNHIRIELKDCFFVPSHISKDMIRRLVDSTNLEIDDLEHLPTCESCLKEKMTKKPFVGQSAIANGLLDLIHTDICGPLSTPARRGFSYFISFTDDHSRYDYVYLMRYKFEAFERFKEYRPEVENQTGRKIKSTSVGSRFIGYPKETAGSYFYDPAEQKNFISRNAVFLEKSFSSDSRCDEVFIEESSKEPHHDSTTSFEPPAYTDGVPVLRKSTGESRVPKRYKFMGLTSQLDNDSNTYRKAMSDIKLDK